MKSKGYRVVGEWSDCAEFVSDSNDDSRRIRAVGNQLAIVRLHDELVVDTFFGNGL